MAWCKEDIKSLRLRYGWSQSDLARRLSCSGDEVAGWENGSHAPLFKHERMLDLLGAHVDSCAEEVKSFALADAFLEGTNLTQIESSKIS